MMFLFAGHSAGLLSKNFVKQSFTKFLESQLHGSRRKSYLSAPFFLSFTLCVQRSWTTLAGVSPVTVIASEPCS